MMGDVAFVAPSIAVTVFQVAPVKFSRAT